MKKIIFSIFFIVGLIAGSIIFRPQEAKATGLPQVSLCHKLTQPHQTISVSIAAVAAHIAHGDSLGACVTITPIPTVRVTPKISCTPTPTPTIVEEEPTVTPTPTEPEATPSASPTEEPKQEGGTPPQFAGSSTDAPRCEQTAPTKTMANFHVYRNGDAAIVKWVPTEGDRAHIYYKQVDSAEWQHAVRDIFNTGYFEIEGLGTQDITFAGQQANGCAGGPLTHEVVDGPTDYWTLFR